MCRTGFTSAREGTDQQGWCTHGLEGEVDDRVSSFDRCPLGREGRGIRAHDIVDRTTILDGLDQLSFELFGVPPAHTPRHPRAGPMVLHHVDRSTDLADCCSSTIDDASVPA